METLQIHAYDWIIKDKFGDNDQTTIDCWALDNESNPYLIQITNFPVFCVIELPLYNSNKRQMKWNSECVQHVVTRINSLLHEENKILKCNLSHHQTLYYYKGGRTNPFIRVFFKNLTAMKICRYKLDNAIYTDLGLLKLNMYEDDIDVVRKLLTNKECEYSAWFQIKATLIQEELKISTLDREYIGNWTTMKLIDYDICKDWETRPGILSWDIECYTDNHLAMPNKFHDRHVAYMISAIYKRYKQHETLQRYGIIIGDCNQIPKDKLDQCTIIKVKNECELVDAFGKIVIDTDPEILAGYNIFVFDYPYLDHRIMREIHHWPKMSRIRNEIPTIKSNNWKSDGAGHMDINYLQISGRISIDMYPVIKRDYNLDTYTLDAVSWHFLKKNKCDVSPIQMFQYYEQMEKAVTDLKEETGMIQEEKEINNDAKEEYDIKEKNRLIHERNFEIRLRNKEMREKHEEAFKKALDKTTEVMEYCIRDSELVLELMESVDVWVGLLELSNIFGVTIVNIFTKGQQVRCLSQLYNLAVKHNYVINKRGLGTFHYKGGKVQDPIPGLHENIICLDFRSLYPSIMQAYNICYTTLVAKEHMDLVPDDQCHVIEFIQDEEEEDEKENDKNDSKTDRDVEEEDPIIFKKNKKKVKKINLVHYKFKFYKNKTGVLPLLVKNLVAKRNEVRAQQKKEKNPHVRMVLEKRQLALKCSANSFYGFLAVREGGKLPCIEAAMCITAKGRELITYVGEHLQKKYNAIVVAGDTDCTRAHTPILIRYKNVVNGHGTTETIAYIQIKDLMKFATPVDKKIYDKEKKYDDGRQHFYVNLEHIEVWTDNGWSKIKYLMRRKNVKQLYRVVTGTGVVDVTEDHSLLNQEGVEVRINDIKLGSKLLHKNLPNEVNTLLPPEAAWALGFLMAEGTCARIGMSNVDKNTLSVSGVDLYVLEQMKKYLEILEPDYNFIIDDTILSSAVYKLTIRADSLTAICEKYVNIFYTGRSDYVKTHKNTNLGKAYKKIPDEIFNSSTEAKRAFLNGWYAGDGDFDCLVGKLLHEYQKKIKIKVINDKVKNEPNAPLLHFNNLDSYINTITSSISYKKLEDLLDKVIHSDFFIFEHKVNNKSKYRLINATRTLLMYECGPLLTKNDNNTLTKDKYNKLLCTTHEAKEKIVNDFLIDFMNRLIVFIHGILNETADLNFDNSSSHILRLMYQQVAYMKQFAMENKTDCIFNMKDYLAHMKYHLYSIVELEKYKYRLHYMDCSYQMNYGRSDIVGQIGAAGLFYIASAVGLHVNINDQKTEDKTKKISMDKNTYRVTFKNKPDKTDTKESDTIKKIIPLGVLDEDVFDIETENHHFAAGPGRMIVHNSVMVDIHIKDSKDCQFWGDTLSQEISGVKAGIDPLPGQKELLHTKDIPGFFPEPLGTEYEKGMRIFVLRKKKYAAYLIDSKGNFKKKVEKDANGIVIRELDELEMLKKGIVLARRDNNKLLKDLYYNILVGIMDKKPFLQAFTALLDTLIALNNNEVDHMALKSTRALGQRYKSASNFMNIFANELRKKGKIVNPGDRLAFLVAEHTDPKILVGYKMVLLDDYVQSLKTDTPIKLDYKHYIKKVLANPIDQLFEVGYGKYLEQYKHITYKPERKRNFVYLTTPCTMAFHMLENGVDLLKFKNAVVEYITRAETPKPFKINIIS